MEELDQIQAILAQHGYQYKQILGQGGFSTVLLCHSEKYNHDFAVKRTIKNRMTEDEYNTLVSLTHPHIIKLYDAFEDENSQYLVMEYCPNGTIKEKGKLNYTQFIYYAKQLLDSLAYCHAKKIAHRDIKPANILFDQYENTKLADFGIAKIFDINSKSDEKCGSIKFFAPEMFQSNVICPFKADIWALGITFFCMATGKYPFHGSTKKEIKQNILIGELNFSKYDVDQRIRFLILKMTQMNPQLRQSPDKLLKLSMFSSSSIDKKLHCTIDQLGRKPNQNGPYITSYRSVSMTFENDLSSSSYEDVKKTADFTKLHSFRSINKVLTTPRNNRHFQSAKPT